VPCLFEGCDRHLDSVSRCLQDISVEQVVEAARSLLADSLPA
jgi:heptosyltransferase-3